jgi:translocation and assembly module TamB
MRKFTKYLAWSFLTLCVFSLVLVFVASSTLGVRSAVYFANKVDGISIEGTSGSLYSQIDIKRIEVDIEDVISIDARSASIDLELNCLLDLAACLSHIKLQSIDITLPSSSPPGVVSEQTQQYISLPIPIEVKVLSVQRLGLFQALEQGEAERILSVAQLELTNAYGFNDITLDALKAKELLLYASAAANQVASKGHEEFSLKSVKALIAQAPLINVPQIFIPVNAALDELKIEQLCWQVKTSPKPASCIVLPNAKLSVQQQLVKLDARIFAPELLAAQGILASSIMIDAEVKLAENYTHELNLQLLKTNKANDQPKLLVEIKGDLAQTQINANLVEQAARRNIVSVNAAGRWQQKNLPLDVSVSLVDFAALKVFWQSPFDFELPKAKIAIKGDWTQYELVASASLASLTLDGDVESDISLIASVSLSDAKADIAQFHTRGVLGDIALSGELALQQQDESLTKAGLSQADLTLLDSNRLALVSKLDLALENVNLGALRRDLQSDISGRLSLSHIFTETWMQGSAKCNGISGEIMDYTLSAKCDISLSPEGLINIHRFELQEAQNTVIAQGHLQFLHTNYLTMDMQQFLQSTGELSFDAQLNTLNSLYMHLSGSASMQGRFSGSVAAPQLELSANAQSFSADDLAVENLSLALAIDADDNYQGDLQLDVSQLKVNSVLIESINAVGSGNKDKHSLELSVSRKDLKTTQVLTGALNVDAQTKRWQGKWLEGEILLPYANLILDDEAEIVADFIQQNYTLGDHCWVDKDTTNSICLSELAYTDNEVSAALNLAFDVANIARHYSSDLILPDTRLPLTSQVNASFSEPKGLKLTAYSTVIGGEVETERHMLELDAIVANITLEDEMVEAAIFAGTKETGILGLQSNISLHPDKPKHKSRLRIDDFNLNLLQRFIPSTQSILGMVNANVGIEGPFDEPQLSGDLSISDGELILDAYTYPLTKFSHQMSFDGQTANMVGDFNLGTGSGDYSADIHFAEPFSVNGQLNGKNMQFAFGKSNAEVSPELDFLFSPGDLTLKGQVAITSALVKLEELPENAKTPSSDTIIIGQKEPEPIVPLALDIDLDILIDEPKEERVKINAFDLEATLTGDLNLQVTQIQNEEDGSFQPMRTLLFGQVEVLNGSYEAYAQKLLVDSGKILFNGEPSLPEFHIRAIRNPLNTEGDVIAGLRIRGNPVVPRVELFSEPNMIQARQLSYLLQGKDIKSDEDDNSSQSNTALINALIGFGVGRSENGVGQIGNALGFDSLNLQTAGAGDDSQVQITGRIAKDIQITYGIGVFDQASEVILKYQIMPKLFIEAKTGVASTIDLFYEISRGEFLPKNQNKKSTTPTE